MLEEGVSVGGNPSKLPKGGSLEGGGTANRHSQVTVNSMGLGTTKKPKEENQLLCWHQTQASPRVHTRRRAELLLMVTGSRVPVVPPAGLLSECPGVGGSHNNCAHKFSAQMQAVSSWWAVTLAGGAWAPGSRRCRSRRLSP